MEVDTSRWSGDGDVTQAIVDALRDVPGIASLRVEDAPASRSDSSFLFLSNEVYLRFETRERIERTRWLGVFSRTRRCCEAAQTLSGVESILGGREGIGPADYRDDGMLQYLRTERIVPPYQTRGYKLVELVRIYEARGEGGAPAA